MLPLLIVVVLVRLACLLARCRLSAFKGKSPVTRYIWGLPLRCYCLYLLILPKAWQVISLWKGTHHLQACIRAMMTGLGDPPSVFDVLLLAKEACNNLQPRVLTIAVNHRYHEAKPHDTLERKDGHGSWAWLLGAGGKPAQLSRGILLEQRSATSNRRRLVSSGHAW